MYALIIAPRFHPCYGGFESYSCRLATSLAGLGHRVTVLTTNAIDLEYLWLDGYRHVPAGHEYYDGIEIHRFPICHRRWLRRAGRFLGFIPHWTTKARFARPSFRTIGLAETLRNKPADVIHVGPLPYNQFIYYGIREARRRGIRVLTTPCTHFGEDDNSEVARHYTSKFQIEMLNECDAVLALTELEKERLVELGVSRQKVHVTGIGIISSDVCGGDAASVRSRWQIRDPIVLHFGMKAWDKGSVSVVEALKLLWKTGLRIHLVLAGPSLRAFDEYFRNQALPLDQVTNLGPIRQEEKRNLLAAADVVVQPSRVESLGLVYLEAWANVKPVIGARTAVMEELIEPERGGLLIPFGEAEALALAIKRLVDHPEESKAMGSWGQRKVNQFFLWETAFQRIHPFFAQDRTLRRAQRWQSER